MGQSQGFEYFIAGAVVFFLSIGAYASFVFFLPEWVGLTGPVAKEAEKSHIGGYVEETSFWKRMDAEPVSVPAERMAEAVKNASLPADETRKV